MRPIRSHVLAILGVGLATPLLAQGRSPVSVEASAGVGLSRGGGTYRNRMGIALDATLAWRIRPTESGAVVVGLSGGMQGAVGSMADICVVASNGGCAPAYPVFYSVAALAGREWGRGRPTFARVLAGPAYYQAGARDGGGSAVGVQGRVDLATPVRGRVAVVGSVRGAALPSFRGDAHAHGAVALGVRVQ